MMSYMDYQPLGRTYQRLAEKCLGIMTFGDGWGCGAKDEARKR